MELQVIQSIASTRLDHGGTSRSIPALCDALVASGCNNHLVTAIPANSEVPCNFPLNRDRVHLARESRIVRQFGVGKQFVQIIAELSRGYEKSTVVHDHAIWLPTNHAVASYCRRYGITRVVSPRGMMGSWAMSHAGWKKRMAWRLYQCQDLRTASAFHATSDQEAAEIRALGFRQPITVVPNGVTVPDSLPEPSIKDCRQALFLSRIHPKKGLLNLIQAWHRLGEIAIGWQLVIAGPDERGYRATVERESERLGLSHRVRFVGNVEGAAKWQLYVDSDLFVLPSFNENYGIVIAEALSAGLPVITTQQTPWSVIAEKRLGWWIPPTLEALVVAMRDAVGRSEQELRSIGSRGREFARKSASWACAARGLWEFYSSLNRLV